MTDSNVWPAARQGQDQVTKGLSVNALQRMCLFIREVQVWTGRGPLKL
jgi:hypothetical protein